MTKEVELICSGCQQAWVFTEDELAQMTGMIAADEEVVSREITACPKCNKEVWASETHVGTA